MRLLILNYEYPPVGAGAGRIAAHLAREWAVLGISVTVVTAGFQENTGESVEDGVKIIRLPSRRKQLYRSCPREMLSWIRHATQYCLKMKDEDLPDLVFAHFAIPGGKVALKFKQKRNVPYMIMSHYHDIPWLAKKEMFPFHLLTFCSIRKICLNASYRFVQSDEMKNNIDRFVGKGEIGRNILIPNGFDSSISIGDEIVRIPDQVLFAARLVKQKNPFTFLQAAKMVQKQMPDIRFVVAGDGPLRNAMEVWVKKEGLTRNFSFTGWVSNAEMATLFASSSLFVSTSLYEGMSMTIMEALAAGLRVVATPVSNNPKLLESNDVGRLVPICNAEATAEAIIECLNCGVTDREALAAAVSEYSWPQVAARYVDYFNVLTSSENV
ncbi:MAG: glycosyltransferase family 4 protein [Bacteroidetes bacterium]|nr:glycosyltransferase family 4 protein [Bacteroidota bacterium]MBU1719752.1 glycosyltransferase family 4 protein [Bacteroidota bacterium]